MIITRQRPIDQIIDKIRAHPVFLIGCSECATLCNTGGKNELNTLTRTLTEKKIPVQGSLVLEPACHLLNSKRLLAPLATTVAKADVLLVMACGNGVQTIQELYPTKQVVSGTDALFVGEIIRAGVFEKRCNLCGDCLLDQYGGLCPVARCPKSMLNGPCSGLTNGKCEQDPTMPCIWDLIYQTLKERNQLDLLKRIHPPKDWSKGHEGKAHYDHK
jgi:hypothetical protein